MCRMEKITEIEQKQALGSSQKRPEENLRKMIAKLSRRRRFGSIVGAANLVKSSFQLKAHYGKSSSEQRKLARSEKFMFSALTV